MTTSRIYITYYCRWVRARSRICCYTPRHKNEDRHRHGQTLVCTEAAWVTIKFRSSRNHSSNARRATYSARGTTTLESSRRFDEPSFASCGCVARRRGTIVRFGDLNTFGEPLVFRPVYPAHSLVSQHAVYPLLSRSSLGISSTGQPYGRLSVLHACFAAGWMQCM